MKKIIAILIIIIVAVIGGYFAWTNLMLQKAITPVVDQNLWKTYTNSDFGFTMNFPDSWKGYTIDGGKIWHGNNINDPSIKYDGPMIVIINPQTTPQQQYQDIPIMVFTHEEWLLVSGDNPKVAVSAAPIGPAKIGENAKYIFANPPRWYGFTDAIGYQEAVEIVKIFKAF